MGGRNAATTQSEDGDDHAEPERQWIVDLLTGGDLLPEILRRAPVCLQTLDAVPAVCSAWRDAWPAVLAAFPVVRLHGQVHPDIFVRRGEIQAAQGAQGFSWYLKNDADRVPRWPLWRHR